MADRLDWLRRGRRHAEDRLEKASKLHTLSAARYQLHRAVSDALDRHAGTRILEAGAGRSPYLKSLTSERTLVVRIDIQARETVDVIADVQNLQAFADESFDAVLCTQVLEHVIQPEAALQHMSRVLKPGGALILSAPHLSIVHDAPHDYFRYTSFGLSELCRRSGLEVTEVRPIGSVASFLGHPLSGALLGAAAWYPWPFWFVWSFNYLVLVRLLDVLDRWVAPLGILPRDVLVVARRPGGSRHRDVVERAHRERAWLP